MDKIVSVFQFEIRYNHILNFSQIARKILSPYVKLAQSIKLENQNTINEQIILNFENDDYVIIVSWDRILIKGQESLDNYIIKNSPIEMPFFSILNKISSLEEFGSIQNILLAVNYIKEIEKTNLSKFMEKTIQETTSNVLDDLTDIAITLERNKKNEKVMLSFGPYSGPLELSNRPLVPVNLKTLSNTNFSGVMLEYKCFKIVNKVTFNDFINMTKESNELFKKVWNTL